MARTRPTGPKYQPKSKSSAIGPAKAGSDPERKRNRSATGTVRGLTPVDTVAGVPESADIAIVGAGITGLATAYALTRDGHRSVAIFDRSWPGSGDSGRSFSMVRRHYSNAVTARLAMSGSQTIADWENEVGVADAGYVRCGYLLTVPERLAAACRDNVARLQRIGLDTRFLEPEEIGQVEPEISTDGVAGAAY